jgi:hypothetical protein
MADPRNLKFAVKISSAIGSMITQENKDTIINGLMMYCADRNFQPALYTTQNGSESTNIRYHCDAWAAASGSCPNL